jgi:hypothetical protein
MATSIDASKLQLWRQRIAQCEQSPLTVVQFCQSIGCSVPTYYQWKRKVEQSKSKTNTFLEVRTPTPLASFIEIKLPNGIAISVPSHAVELLAEILERVA